MPKNYDYNTPSVPFIINHHNQSTSQRFTVEVASVLHSFDLTYFQGRVPNTACSHPFETSFQSQVCIGYILIFWSHVCPLVTWPLVRISYTEILTYAEPLF